MMGKPPGVQARGRGREAAGRGWAVETDQGVEVERGPRLELRHLGVLHSVPVPGVDEDDPVRVLAFGRQVDALAVSTRCRPDGPAGPLNPEQVARYLAKYATKSAAEEHRENDDHHVRQPPSVTETVPIGTGSRRRTCDSP